MNGQEGTLAVDTDVLVIGGGPAGSTVAALLAKKGWRVTLFEKDRHPRFHIGESLLPQNLPLLDQLGVREQVETSSMTKYGIEFVSPFHGKKVQYEFAKAWGRRLPYAFQVQRSSFDHILLQNAAQSGAQVYEDCEVKSVELNSGASPAVVSEDADGHQRHWTAKFIVDATGRDTLLAAKLGAKEQNQRNKSAAIFAHFTGARRLLGKAEGHITIVWFDEGWFWFIPLAGDTTSVGAVCSPEFLKTRKTDLTSFFYSIIDMSPEIAERLQDATMVGKVTATGNYSYKSSVTSGPNFLMVGDASSFIDPVFSTGVYLAMRGGFSAAEAVDTCLRYPERSKKALKRYDVSIRHAVGAFTWFIYRIRQPAMRNLFMSPRNTWRMEEAVLSLLAGGISEGWQVSLRLYLFRAMYYATKFSRFLRGARKSPSSVA
ncbi:NAD(P)/FAD-dependent oxidoreductase [Acidithiobacillus sp. IBUN Pt1247-S3]|uniref:NAD(P)/FAD-dependent oxidoreductase n=1 Tax=Acidithiobacillus sp. IBUN Pt1247-S3 TaxID=3166642 RepID=UPI0034E5E1EC